MNVFVDTSAFLALIVEDDIHHVKAIERWQHLLDDSRVVLYSSNYVVVETISLLRQRLGNLTAQRFFTDNLPALTILWIYEPVHTAAIAVMLTQGRNGPSLVDCSSFILMQEHHISHAFAFDKHFTQQGY